MNLLEILEPLLHRCTKLRTIRCTGQTGGASGSSGATLALRVLRTPSGSSFRRSELEYFGFTTLHGRGDSFGCAVRRGSYRVIGQMSIPTGGLAIGVTEQRADDRQRIAARQSRRSKAVSKVVHAH